MITDSDRTEPMTGDWINPTGVVNNQRSSIFVHQNKNGLYVSHVY